MKTALVWFRNDLRIHDHEPLSKALKDADQVICFYCFDSNYWREDKFGHLKCNGFRTQFLRESVSGLSDALKALGGKLTVRSGNTAEALYNLYQECPFDAVYFTDEHTEEEKTIEKSARAKLESQVTWHGSETLTLFHREDLPMAVEELPDVFTAFRKKVEKYAHVRETYPTPESISCPDIKDDGTVPDWAWFGMEEPSKDHRAVLDFKGGEQAALERLDYYFWETEKLKYYKETRNGLVGADYSSKFSAWLGNGSISPRKIYWEVQRFEESITKNSSTYWLVFELIWRDFFRFHALKYNNDIFMAGGIRDELPQMPFDEDKFEAWKQAGTGIPFIDANMKELKLTGYMSNRGRQNVASYLVKDLEIDWRYGASWFESQLVDYDVCSNWCNWNYVSGVGTDPRKERYFNIIKQANGYDGDGEYVKLWLPELKPLIKEHVHQPYLFKSQYPELEIKYKKPLYTSPRWKN